MITTWRSRDAADFQRALRHECLALYLDARWRDCHSLVGCRKRTQKDSCGSEFVNSGLSLGRSALATGEVAQSSSRGLRGSFLCTQVIASTVVAAAPILRASGVPRGKSRQQCRCESGSARQAPRGVRRQPYLWVASACDRKAGTQKRFPPTQLQFCPEPPTSASCGAALAGSHDGRAMEPRSRSGGEKRCGGKHCRLSAWRIMQLIGLVRAGVGCWREPAPPGGFGRECGPREQALLRGREDPPPGRHAARRSV